MFDANAAANAGRGDWSTPPYLGTLDIETDGAVPKITGVINGPFGFTLVEHATGIVLDQGPSSQNGVDDWNREIAVFVFPEDVVMGGSFTSINVVGSRPFVILARGGLTLNKEIDVSGSDAGNWVEGNSNPIAGGAGVAGGGTGGTGSPGPLTEPKVSVARGEGPGNLSEIILAGSLGYWPGAGFGGRGDDSNQGASPVYGDLLERLQAGSGGGGVVGTSPVLDPDTSGGGGGAGGGAVELGATGTLTINAEIRANGGTGSAQGGTATSISDGSNGSGGGVLLHANDVVVSSGLRANARNNTQSRAFHPGGGGRIALLESGLASYTFGDGLATIGLGNVQAHASSDDALSGVITISPQLARVKNGFSVVLIPGYIANLEADVHSTQERVLAVATDLTIQSGGTADYLADDSLDSDDVITVDAGGVLNTNGFSDTVGGLAVNGHAALGAGTTLTTDTFAESGTVAVETGAVLAIGHSGGVSTFTGQLSGGGGLTVLGGAQTMQSTFIYTGPTHVVDGTLTINNTFTTPGDTITVDAPGTLLASGILQRDLAGDGSVTATGALVLGSLTSGSGISFDGTLNAGANQVVLFDANTAELGAQTNVAAGGQLNAINGAALGNGEQVTATGPASIDGVFTNDGTVNGPAGPGEFLTFHKDVTGIGSFTGNIEFLQGYSPGASPAAISIDGNVALGPASQLLLELAGLAPGTGHDRLAISGNLGAAGGLTVALLDGYHPSLGDAFDVLAFGSVTGGFSAITLPALGGGLAFDASQVLTTGTLTVVPEPGTFAITAVAWLVGAATRRRHRHANVR